MHQAVPRARRLPLALLAIAAIAACDPATVSLSGNKAAAKEVAVQLVAARDPVIEPEPVAQCAAANATAEEASAIVAAARSGDTSGAQAVLDTMLRKTTTQQCLVAVGIPDFL